MNRMHRQPLRLAACGREAPPEPTAGAAERAVRIAQDTDGVRSVESQLTVQAG